MARTKKVNIETEAETTATRYNDRETCVNFYGSEDFLTIYTCQPKWVNKVKKMVEEHPDECTVMFDNGKDGIEVQMPVGCFKFSWPRTMSAENREKARERCKRLGGLRKKKNVEAEEPVEVDETEDVSEEISEADEVEVETETEE